MGEQMRYVRRWWHRWEVVTVEWFGAPVEPHQIAGYVTRRGAVSRANRSRRFQLRSEVHRVV